MNNFDFNLTEVRGTRQVSSILAAQAEGLCLPGAAIGAKITDNCDCDPCVKGRAAVDAEVIADALVAEKPQPTTGLVDHVESDQLDDLRKEYRTAISDGDTETAKRIASKGQKIRAILLRAAKNGLYTPSNLIGRS